MKTSKDTKNLMVTLIPFGMIFGCAIGVIIGIFSNPSLLFTTTLGTVIGFLFGVTAYVIYSMKEEKS